MAHFEVSRLISSRPLQRAAAGSAGGFIACLAITWAERMAGLLNRLSDLAMALLDVEVALVWAAICLLLFVSMRNPVLRMVVTSIASVPFSVLFISMNHLSPQDPGYARAVAPMAVLFITCGFATAIIGNQIDQRWRKGVGE